LLQCWLRKFSEQSEPNEYVSQTDSFVNTAGEASLGKMFVTVILLSMFVTTVGLVNAASEASLRTMFVALLARLTRREKRVAQLA
jgi:hypothetical protein